MEHRTGCVAQKQRAILGVLSSVNTEFCIWHGIVLQWSYRTWMDNMVYPVFYLHSGASVSVCDSPTHPLYLSLSAWQIDGHHHLNLYTFLFLCLNWKIYLKIACCTKENHTYSDTNLFRRQKVQPNVLSSCMYLICIFLMSGRKVVLSAYETKYFDKCHKVL